MKLSLAMKWYKVERIGEGRWDP